MNGNVRADMLRPGMQQPTMVMNPSFMQNSPPPGPPQLGQNHLGMPTNPNMNTGMMMGNPTNPMHPSQQQQQQRYHLPIQPQSGPRQPRPIDMRPGPGGGPPMMNTAGGPIPGGGAPQMSGLPHNMVFSGGMMQHGPNPAVRRVSSQPQLPTSGPIAGMPPGVTNNLSLGMGPQPNMRQITPQMRQQIMTQHHHMQGQIPPEMPLGMNRQGGNPGMVPGRTGSAQIMNSLSQPASLPHSMGHLPNQFQNPSIPAQHQQPQIPSPRAGSHTPSLSMATPGPSHTPVNRPQMTTDNGQMSYMGFPNSQFPQPHNNSQMPSTNGQFGFVPSSTPPMADMPQPLPGMGTPSGTPTRPGFPTPAQQYKQMNTSPDGYPNHFGMAPPPHIPPRPPSHNNHHPPLPQQQQHPPPPPQHHSPHHSDHMNANPQRPPSQPQTIPRPSSQSGRQSHTPRPSQPQLPPAPPGPRLSQSHANGPPPGHQLQMPATGPQLAIAPRPPPPPATSGPSANPPPSQTPSDTPPSGPATIPRAPLSM